MAKAGPETVAIVGLNALARDLKRLPDSDTLLKALRESARTAAQPVAAAVQAAIPHVSGNLAGSVRVYATRTGATIREGNKTDVLYAGPADFGGWPPRRSTSYPFQPEGRWLYPTAKRADLSDVALRAYTAAIQKAVDEFNWTNEGGAESVHD